MRYPHAASNENGCTVRREGNGGREVGTFDERVDGHVGTFAGELMKRSSEPFLRTDKDSDRRFQLHALHVETGSLKVNVDGGVGRRKRLWLNAKGVVCGPLLGPGN